MTGGSATDAILEALDPEQRAVATAVHGQVVVLAGAGTGKTRAITHRIAYASATKAHDARKTLALTFTARAAGEMKSRLRDLQVDGVQARTFHAAALRQLRYFWPRLVGGSFPELMSSKAGLVAESMARCALPRDPSLVRDMAAEIEWSKVGMLTPATYQSTAVRVGREPVGSLSPADVARTYDAYEELRSDRHLLDFEDVLLLTVAALESRDDIAEEVRRTYRWFTVDEYQDVNPLQERLLGLWLGDHGEVCVVGDSAQTIYTFAGATPEYLLNFRKKWPESTEVHLVRNYRSTPQIVAVANRVVAAMKSNATLRLEAQRPVGPAPEISAFADEPEEAMGVAARIRGLVESGVSPRDIAVLYRINAQSQAYEEALAEVGVPVALRGGERFFDRSEVREAITRLRGAARADESGATLGAIVRAVLAPMKWTDQAPKGRGAVRERWESLAALVGLADDLHSSSLAELVAELDRRAEIQHSPEAASVTMASLHAAKGLEWEHVFIVGLNEGMLPYIQSDTPEQIAEERRLFYVGITRARTGLYLSWAAARQPGGRASRNPSRFLADLAGPDIAGSGASGVVHRGTAKPRAARERKKPAVCRVCGTSLVTAGESAVGRCRDCPATYDEALFERLKEWRSEQAKISKLPAYVIFTDVTLQVLAERKPKQDKDFLAVTGIGLVKLQKYGESLRAIIDAAE